ncbi:hypothetical protein BH23PLA1_BH23PLA1_20090 [soil metagenome]
MTNPQDQDFEAIDQLVRSHLDREAGLLDLTRLQTRIRASRQTSEPTGPRSRSLVWALVAASIVIGAFLGGRYLGPAEASASTLLRNVRATHSGEIDRCYRVHYAPDPRYWDRSKVIEGPSESVLWTRGDRFRSDCSIGAGAIELTIGREADGTLWVSPSRDKGIRFEDSNLPEEVSALVAINALTVPALVDDVLSDFDLRAEGPSSRAKTATSVVWARPKPGHSHPLISSALLEIDSRSETLLHLVLWISREGRPNGTVTYTYLEQSEQADQFYHLEAALDPGAEIEIHRFEET